MRLNLRSIADRDTFLYINKRPDKNIIINYASIQILETDNRYIFAEFHISNSNLLDLGFIQDISPSRQYFGWKRKNTSFPVSIDS